VASRPADKTLAEGGALYFSCAWEKSAFFSGGQDARPLRQAGRPPLHRLATLESGGGPPHSKTLPRPSAAWENAKRLGLRRPLALFETPDRELVAI